jgi:hypothetical protein
MAGATRARARAERVENFMLKMDMGIVGRVVDVIEYGKMGILNGSRLFYVFDAVKECSAIRVIGKHGSVKAVKE